LTATLFLAVVAALALFVPVAAAQDTGRIERCAVQSPDFGTVIVAYTLDDQAAVQVAAGQCAYLISTGAYIAATNHVGLTDNPDFARVCMVEYSGANSIDVFRSVYQPSSSYHAVAACDAADNGTALVSYD
jgi:hypothetical protein